MTPITRLEVFLNGIINGGEVPEPITRTEIMLNDIKNGDVVTLTPITRGECYLARISGANVQIPEPITRVEMYLAKKCGVDIVTPSPIVRIEHWLNAWASGEDPLVTLTGKIISFFSKAAKPFKSTQLAIEPVQDLHGYEAPWPPGGGANQWDEEWEQGLISASNGQNTPSDQYCRTKNYIAVAPSTNYYFKNTPSPLYIRRYASDKSFLGYLQLGGNTTWTTPADTYYIRFCWDGQTYSNNIAFNYPSSVTTYSPYSNISPISGHTGADIFNEAAYDPTAQPKVSLTFGSTVYGGTASDNGDGSWTVVADRAMETYNSASGFESHNSGRWYHYGLPSGADYSKRTSAISNQATYSDTFDEYKPYFAFGSAGVYVNKLESTETIEAFGARLQANPMTICYYLATPITFTISGDTLETLVGVNTVWADTNGDLTVEVYGTPMT